MSRRCRLCTSNDRDALIEHLAEEMWEAQREREVDPPWAKAQPYWQSAMRGFAATTVRLLGAKHG